MIQPSPMAKGCPGPGDDNDNVENDAGRMEVRGGGQSGDDDVDNDAGGREEEEVGGSVKVVGSRPRLPSHPLTNPHHPFHN